MLTNTTKHIITVKYIFELQFQVNMGTSTNSQVEVYLKYSGGPE